MQPGRRLNQLPGGLVGVEHIDPQRPLMHMTDAMRRERARRRFGQGREDCQHGERLDIAGQATPPFCRMASGRASLRV